MHQVPTVLAYGYAAISQSLLPQSGDKIMRKTRSEDGADRTSAVRAARAAPASELPYWRPLED